MNHSSVLEDDWVALEKINLRLALVTNNYHKFVFWKHFSIVCLINSEQYIQYIGVVH